MKTLKKLFELLNPSERRRAVLLMGMIFVMALLDMFSVASILPFIAVLADPQLIHSNPHLNTIFRISNLLGVQSADQFLLALGIFIFALLILSLAFKAVTSYAHTHFNLMREYTIGKRLIEGYLHQPYSWFLHRNSADLGKTILSDVTNVINGYMMPLMNCIAQGAVTLALLFLLLIVDPLLALSTGIVIITAYGCIFSLVSGRLKRLGEARIRANQERFAAVSEAFGAAKEVKLAGLESAYIQRFASSAQIFAAGQASAQVIAQLPRFALEAISFGGMLFILLYLMSRGGNLASVLPIIALYAFSGYRLIPALQQIYGAFTQLRFVGPTLDALHADFIGLQSFNVEQNNPNPMQLTKAIELNQVVYSYPNVPNLALKRINLIIPALSTVGLVGSTGSGKTTVADVILGLLEPQQGDLRVDGTVITSANRRQLQKAIGYVPQQIYLTDNSIAANIAFGINPKDINYESIERAARIANLHDFVINELPQRYDTVVGERGVRLSGGQRQRIGIARALYHKPRILILDEATSALDNITEQAVMEAISNLRHEITIILIAHRLTTVQHCDLIYLLEHGKVEAGGTYQELVAGNRLFKKMSEKVN
jgi:ABC-type multidrug transport system fused ATPase/permease subunit